MTLSLPIAPEANELLRRSPLALLLGMLLDQQQTMEKAFGSPYELERRLGHALDAGELADYDEDELIALFSRPPVLHRFPKGLAGDKVHQKRVPAGGPPWIETVRLPFPRWNRTADELCVTELGAVIWAVQMSTVEFHPWNSRRADVESPDEWRIDLDPMPDCSFDRVRRVAAVTGEVLYVDGGFSIMGVPAQGD